MTNEDIKLIFDALDRAGVPEDTVVRITDELKLLFEPEEPYIIKAHPTSLILCPVCGSKYVVNECGIVMRHCPNCGKVIKVKE